MKDLSVARNAVDMTADLVPREQMNQKAIRMWNEWCFHGWHQLKHRLTNTVDRHLLRPHQIGLTNKIDILSLYLLKFFRFIFMINYIGKKAEYF